MAFENKQVLKSKQVKFKTFILHPMPTPGPNTPPKPPSTPSRPPVFTRGARTQPATPTLVGSSQLPASTATPTAEAALPSTPEKNSLPVATPVGQLQIKGAFLLEGAVAISANKFAFVNVYNAPALDPENTSEHYSMVVTLDTETGDLKQTPLPKELCASAVLPTNNPDLLLVVTNKGIYTLNHNARSAERELTLWHRPAFIDEWPAGTRSNDCRIDPEGNLLMSWMGEDSHRGAEGARQGELYLIRPDRTETKLLDGLFIPNGHVFIPHDQGVYIVLFNDTARQFSKNPAVNSLPRGIDAYEYRPAAGTMTRIDCFHKFEGGNEVKAFPDGMAISADAKTLLVPMFFGGGVEVIDLHTREGKAVGLIPTPGAAQCTSIAILPGKSEALITTAAEFYRDSDFVAYPNAGSMFTVSLESLNVTGAPINNFKII